MENMKRILLIVLIAIVTSACNAQQTPGVATQIAEPGFTQSAGSLPRTESEVPRVTIEDARAALESGSAVIVDVRSAAAYEQRHIAGAISIPLEELENNPTGLSLDKDQWIITYCA